MAFDRPFLFANLTGVLAYFGMNILRGKPLPIIMGLSLTLSNLKTVADLQIEPQ